MTTISEEAIVTPIRKQDPPPPPPPVSSGLGLALALARAQAVMRSVKKDRDVEAGAKYSFRYATLAAIWDVIREPLASNGLAVVQLPSVDVTKGVVAVETKLLHVSGEWIASKCELPVVQKTPQGIGAVITYARRYGLSAMVGVVSDDEPDVADAEPVLSQHQSQQPQSRTPPPAKASPPKPVAPKPPAGPPVSAAELEQHLRSCTSVAELTKTAAKIQAAVRAAAITDAERVHLLSVFTAAKTVLQGQGAP